MIQNYTERNQMIIAWFSCGVTSSVACKIALSLYEDVQFYYIETGSGHPDNARFLSDCERWYDQPIHIIRSDKYTCVADVLRKGFINGAHGAACTLELKKKVLKRKSGTSWKRNLVLGTVKFGDSIMNPKRLTELSD